MIRLLIQSVKVDKSDDVIRALEQYRAVDGFWSHLVVLQPSTEWLPNFTLPRVDKY